VCVTIDTQKIQSSYWPKWRCMLWCNVNSCGFFDIGYHFQFCRYLNGHSNHLFTWCVCMNRMYCRVGSARVRCLCWTSTVRGTACAVAIDTCVTSTTFWSERRTASWSIPHSSTTASPSVLHMYMETGIYGIWYFGQIKHRDLWTSFFISKEKLHKFKCCNAFLKTEN